MATTKALFLDRDGTVINDKENLFYTKDIKFIDGIFDLLLAAKKRSYKIILVTNQTIVSKGLQNYSEMKKINNIILDKINFQIGIKAFDDVFICPFHPNANVKKYKFEMSVVVSTVLKEKKNVLFTNCNQHK